MSTKFGALDLFSQLIIHFFEAINYLHELIFDSRGFIKLVLDQAPSTLMYSADPFLWRHVQLWKTLLPDYALIVQFCRYGNHLEFNQLHWCFLLTIKFLISSGWGPGTKTSCKLSPLLLEPPHLPLVSLSPSHPSLVSLGSFILLWWAWAPSSFSGELGLLRPSLVSLGSFIFLWWTWALSLSSVEFELFISSTEKSRPLSKACTPLMSLCRRSHDEY